VKSRPESLAARWRTLRDALDSSRALTAVSPTGEPNSTTTGELNTPERTIGIALIIDQVTESPAGVSAVSDPLVKQASGRLGSDVTASGLSHIHGHATLGLENALVGTMFEQRVVTMLSNGQLSMPNGATTAQIADRTRPGTDIIFHDAHGQISGVAEVKASGDAQTILRHFDRYPDVPNVYATHEAAVAATKHGAHAIDTGVSNVDLHHQVGAAISDHGTHLFAQLISDSLPEITYAAIFVQAAIDFRRGNGVRQVWHTTKGRAVDATIASTAAAVVGTATGSHLIRIPVLLTTRLAMLRIRAGRDAARRIQTLSDYWPRTDEPTNTAV